MAKNSNQSRKEKKKPKKIGKNARITTRRAMYDNQLVAANPNGLNSGY